MSTMNDPTPIMAFPEPGHNHGSCCAAALARAETTFADRGMKFTALRAKVFAEIAASHIAIGAYQIIERLAQAGTRLAPISVYRALDALLEAGVVHRLESRNAFFACHTSHAASGQQLILVCATCGRVAEVAAQPVFDGIGSVAEASGFMLQSCLVEVAGTCSHCGQAGHNTPSGAPSPHPHPAGARS